MPTSRDKSVPASSDIPVVAGTGDVLAWWGQASPLRCSLALAASAALALVADRLTKVWITTRLLPSEGQSIDVLGPVASLTHVHNSGVAFGLFTNRNGLFGIVAVVVLVVIVNFYRYLPGDLIWLRVSLGLLLGGAAGNLLDRVTQGYVSDFIDLRLWTGHNVWPVFNVADSCVCIAVALLAVFLMMQPSESGRERKGVSYGSPGAGDHPRMSN